MRRAAPTEKDTTNQTLEKRLWAANHAGNTPIRPKISRYATYQA